MTNNFFIRHFGKITVYPIYALVILANYFELNLSYNQYAIDFLHYLNFGGHVRMTVLFFNMLSGLLVTFGYLYFTNYNFAKRPKLTLALFVPFVVLFQFFLISILWDLMSLENNFRADSNEGMAALIIIPICLFLLFVVSLAFDFIKNRKARFGRS